MRSPKACAHPGDHEHDHQMCQDALVDALEGWASVDRDGLVRAAHEAGISANRIHKITGLARTTIARILAPRSDFEHLVPLSSNLGDRGLVHMPPLAGTSGEEIAAFESSTATDPRIWLNIEDVGAAVNTGIELTAGMAWRLSEQLQKLVRDHYQGDARPGWAEGRLPDE